MATDGVTPLSTTYVPDKTADDVITGQWEFQKPIATAGAVNWLRNADFENWMNGPSAAPDDWLLSGASASVAVDRTNYRVSLAAAALTRSGTNCYLSQNIIGRAGAPLIAAWQSRWIAFGCWVRATVASRARIAISDGIGTTYSSYHTGGSGWEWLAVSRSIDAAATKVEPQLHVDTGNTTAQFDGATLVMGKGIEAFIPTSPNGMPVETHFSLLFNGDLEIWGAGASAAPTGWTLSGSVTVTRNAATKRVSTYSADFANASGQAYLYQVVDNIPGFGNAGRLQGRTASFGAWAKTAGTSRLRVAINDGVTTSLSAYHSGSNNWEWLSVSHLIGDAATKLEVRLVTESGASASQFDAATLVLGFQIMDWIPSGWSGRKALIPFGSTGLQSQNTTVFLAPCGGSATENQVSFLPPFKCVARRLRAFLDAAPAAGQTVAFTLRKNETTDTALVATVTDAGRSGVDVTNEVELQVTDYISLKAVLSATSGSRYCRAALEVEEIP